MKTTTAIFSGLFAFMILASAAIIVAGDEFATTEPDEEGTVDTSTEDLGYISNDTTTDDDQAVVEEHNASLPQGPMCVLILEMGHMRMVLIFPWNETYMDGSTEGLPFDLSALTDWFMNWTSSVVGLDLTGGRERTDHRTFPPDMLNGTGLRNCTGNRSFEKDGNITMRDLDAHRLPGHRTGHRYRPMEVTESESS